MDSTAASTALKKKLEHLSQENAESTIYKVHRRLRSVNPKAYEPEVIAIGPYHRDKPRLKMMEDHKLRNLQSLITQGRCNVDKCAEDVGRLESRARKCYADQPSINRLSSSEFVQMLLLDGCFIIELVRKFAGNFSREEGGSIFRMEWMIGSLQRDLMLFENQIPYFVLSKLFDSVEYPYRKPALSHLLFIFFLNLYPGEKRMIQLQKPKVGPDDEISIKHLLDFIHRSWVPPDQKSRDNQENRISIKHLLDFIHRSRVPPDQKSRDNQENGSELVNTNATGLGEANVHFKKNKEAETLFDIEFKDGVLLIPTLSIQDATECLLRNLVAYEQYFEHTPQENLVAYEQHFEHTPQENLVAYKQHFEHTPHDFVTDYIMFWDCLINSSKDVELLLRNEILQNFLGDEEVVAKMVNRLGDWVICSTDGLYAGIAKDLNEHCRKPWNRWMAKLRRNYLNSPWAIISIIGAIVLLLLTITQTVFSILQVVSMKLAS